MIHSSEQDFKAIEFTLWLQTLNQTHQRGFLYIETHGGDHAQKWQSFLDWSNSQGQAIKTYLYSHIDSDTGHPHQKEQLPLGQELDVFIYNLWSGFHPDRFCALAGCVKGGGLIGVFGPPLNKLHLFQDPEYKQMILTPSICPLNTNFLYRLAIQIQKLALIKPASAKILDYQLSITMLRTWSRINNNLPTKHGDSPLELCLNNDQKKAFETIINLKHNVTNWLSLLSERGYGKTTVILQAMKYLACNESNHSIILYISQNKALRKTIENFLPQNNCGDTRYLNQNNQNQNNQDTHHISSNAKAVIKTPTLDLTSKTLSNVIAQGKVNSQPMIYLFVDEAAQYSNKKLENTLNDLYTAYQDQIKVILISSIDGYEGHGRSLMYLKPPKKLTNMALSTPCRWSGQDPIDQWIKFTFFAQTQSLDTHHKHSLDTHHKHSLDTHHKQKHTQLTVRTMNQDDDLSIIMSILHTGHYKTRPSDARLILDGSNQQVYIGLLNNQPVACIWLSYEGRIHSQLHQPIIEKSRRLQGHLAPQYYVHQLKKSDLGLASYELQRSWIRIIRICVLPALQQSGFGTQLIQHVETQHPNHRIAVSFKANPLIEKFWQHCGWSKVTSSFYIQPLKSYIFSEQ